MVENHGHRDRPDDGRDRAGGETSQRVSPGRNVRHVRRLVDIDEPPEIGRAHV